MKFVICHLQGERTFFHLFRCQDVKWYRFWLTIKSFKPFHFKYNNIIDKLRSPNRTKHCPTMRVDMVVVVAHNSHHRRRIKVVLFQCSTWIGQCSLNKREHRDDRSEHNARVQPAIASSYPPELSKHCRTCSVCPPGHWSGRNWMIAATQSPGNLNRHRGGDTDSNSNNHEEWASSMCINKRLRWMYDKQKFTMSKSSEPQRLRRLEKLKIWKTREKTLRGEPPRRIQRYFRRILLLDGTQRLFFAPVFPAFQKIRSQTKTS